MMDDAYDQHLIPRHAIEQPMPHVDETADGPPQFRPFRACQRMGAQQGERLAKTAYIFVRGILSEPFDAVGVDCGQIVTGRLRQPKPVFAAPAFWR